MTTHGAAAETKTQEKIAKAQERARQKHLRQLCVYCGVPFGMHTVQMTLDCANARS